MADPAPAAPAAKKGNFLGMIGKVSLYIVGGILLLLIVTQVAEAIFPMVLRSIMSLFNMLISAGKALFYLLIGPVVVLVICYVLADSFGLIKKK